MLIIFDEPKRLANIEKHGFDFAELDVEFFEAARILPAKVGRFMAIGEFNGEILAVFFRPLGKEALSVVSMRPASRKERRILK
ncbi:BrnT family toxin [Chelatococcus sp. GCM10030263]|uniref:BrnT family toxin n=1 Tax=Chelatococcus sp. GCM10030263 TaxID=3273387 RepID=UPI00360FAA1E